MLTVDIRHELCCNLQVSLQKCVIRRYLLDEPAEIRRRVSTVKVSGERGRERDREGVEGDGEEGKERASERKRERKNEREIVVRTRTKRETASIETESLGRRSVWGRTG